MIGTSQSILLLKETLSANEDSHENHGPSKMTAQFRTSEMRSVRGFPAAQCDLGENLCGAQNAVLSDLYLSSKHIFKHTPCRL